MKEDEDIYMTVVESIRLMALMHHFDEIQAIKTHGRMTLMGFADIWIATTLIKTLFQIFIATFLF